MKLKIFLISFLFSFLFFLSFVNLIAPVEALTRVRGYKKRNGTYVMPHYRTSPNRSLFDNWSTKGNLNPYTGKQGTKDPFKTKFRYIR